MVSRLIVLMLLASGPAFSATFPTDQDWIQLTRSTLSLADATLDGQSGGREIVGDMTASAAYLAQDDEYFFIRLRLDESPAQGADLRPYAWGILIDTNMSSLDYEFALIACGITDALQLWENSNPSGAGSPVDPADSLLVSHDLQNGVNGRVVPAASSFNANPDYFLDLAIPLSDLLTAGIAEGSQVGLWVGSSNSCNSLSTDLAEHLGTPSDGDLIASVSDPVVLIPLSTAVGSGEEPPNRSLALVAAGPNPSTDQISFQIRLSRPGRVWMELLDLRGRRLWADDAVQQTGWRIHTIRGNDLHGLYLSNATYILRVRAQNESQAMKVVLFR